MHLACLRRQEASVPILLSLHRHPNLAGLRGGRKLDSLDRGTSPLYKGAAAETA